MILFLLVFSYPFQYSLLQELSLRISFFLLLFPYLRTRFSVFHYLQMYCNYLIGGITILSLTCVYVYVYIRVKPLNEIIKKYFLFHFLHPLWLISIATLDSVEMDQLPYSCAFCRSSMNLLSLVSSWLTDMCLSTSLFCIFVIVLVRLQTKCLPYQKLHLLLLVCWRLLELHVEWQQEVMHACRFSWSPSVIIIFLTILTKILCLLL